MNLEDLERVQERLDALGPAPRAELLHVLQTTRPPARPLAIQKADVSWFGSNPKTFHSSNSLRSQAPGLQIGARNADRDRRGARVKLQAPFATRVEAQDGVAIMALSGELDMSTAPILREELAQVEDSRTLAIVLDLRDDTFIDSSGLTSSWRRGAVPKATGIACS